MYVDTVEDDDDDDARVQYVRNNNCNNYIEEHPIFTLNSANQDDNIMTSDMPPPHGLLLVI